MAKKPSKFKNLKTVIISLNPALLASIMLAFDEKGSKTPLRLELFDNISSEEKPILEKVYKRVIESLEQLNNKKEEFIINELNSFDKDQT